VYEVLSPDVRRLVGTLAVTMSSANRLNVNLSGEHTRNFSGTWDEVNLINGRVSAELTRGDNELTLALDASGCFSATLRAGGDEIGSGEASVGDFEPFVGSYTVTLVGNNSGVGTAYLVIKTVKAGTTSVSGMMPDGSSVSLSVRLSVNADGSATLPIYKKTSKGTFSAALRIAANAAATWGDEGNTDVIHAVNGCLASWETAIDEVNFTVYGGYWKKGASPLEICELYDLSPELSVVASGEEMASATATKNGFRIPSRLALTTLTFTKSTGVFSGRVRMVVEGVSVWGTVKGVLLPGWIDCGCIEGKTIIERPYGSGTLYYKLNGQTVSEPVDLIAEAAE